MPDWIGVRQQTPSAAQCSFTGGPVRRDRTREGSLRPIRHRIVWPLQRRLKSKLPQLVAVLITDLKGGGRGPTKVGVVPLSDGAREVAAIGEE